MFNDNAKFSTAFKNLGRKAEIAF